MSHFTTRTLRADIVIAGGGMTGVCAALGAARQGATVILCHDRPVLGGNASSEIRMHIVGANSLRPTADLVLEPRESGIIEEIRLENAVRNPQRSPSMFDLILYEKVRTEPNITLLLNTSIVAATVEQRQITATQALRISTEERFEIQSRIAIDCSGDSGLAVAAGAAFMEGREDREQFGEPLAQPTADHRRLGSTLLFMARRHERPMPFEAPPWARKFSEDDLRLRPHGHHLEYGYWWVEWGGELDTLKENEAIRDELLAIILGIWDHIKNGGDHGADHWALDWFGFVPGKRESRRIIGQHILTQNDLMRSVPFDDAIAYGGWPLDLHPPGGIDCKDEKPCTQHPLPYLYDIPLRACVARDLENLMFGGRNLSATHVAFASTRVMATCAVIGEALGIAAALACRWDIPPSRLAYEPEAIASLQQQLLANDLYLIGRRRDQSGNAALQATLSATTEMPNGSVRALLSGQNRALSCHGGLPEDRFVAGTHRWMSRPGLPAAVTFHWSEPIAIATMTLIFDTGLHRHLTLTHSEEFLRFMIWGQGQPETVKDYRIEVQQGDDWSTPFEVHGNWQRVRRHTADEDSLNAVRALRITALSTWGIDHARLVAVEITRRPASAP